MKRLLLLITLTGCVSAERQRHEADLAEARRRVGQPLAVEAILASPPVDQGLEDALRLGPTLEQVREGAVWRNPNARAALERWVAFLERVPQKAVPVTPMAMSRYSRMFDMVEVGVTTGVAFPTKLVADARAAMAEANASREDFRAVENALRAQAASGYAMLWVARRKVAILDENLLLLGRFLEIARTKYKAGSATLPDVLRVETERERVRIERDVLAKEVEVATSGLNALLDRHPDAPVGPLSELTAPSDTGALTALYDKAADRRPELRGASERLAAAEQMLSRARQDWLPDLVLGGAYVRDLGMRRDFYDVSGGISLPWLTGWSVAARAREAEADKARMTAELRAARNAVLDEVKATHARVEAVALRYRRLGDEVIPRVKRNVEASEAAYVAGQVDFLSLIDAERSHLAALLDREEALAEWVARRAELDRVVGE